MLHRVLGGSTGILCQLDAEAPGARHHLPLAAWFRRLVHRPGGCPQLLVDGFRPCPAGSKIRCMSFVNADGVIRTAELRAAGCDSYAVAARCRPSGPWQRVLPGVVLIEHRPADPAGSGLRAAVAYVGRGPGHQWRRCLAESREFPVPGGVDVLMLVSADRRLSGRFLPDRGTHHPAAGPVWLAGLPLAPVAAGDHRRCPARARPLPAANPDPGADRAGCLHSGRSSGRAGSRQPTRERRPSELLACLDDHNIRRQLASMSRT